MTPEPDTRPLGPAASPCSPKIIIGLDPGSLFTGYGLIGSQSGSLTLVKADRLALSSSLPMAQRLALIFETIQSIIETYKPAAMALEEVFTFKNPRSALKLAQARAAALLPAALAGIPIFEYAPQLIKKTVTGSGRAEKSQVAFMVGKILGINEILAEDASDALAIAICHSGQDNLPNTSGAVAAAGRLRGSSWRRMSVSDLKALGYRLEDDS